MTVPQDVARSWTHRWDRQQETYMPDREERFAVIADIVAITTEKSDPYVLDIGCGPGSLSARIHARLPGARLVGVDTDPLLLGLAAANYPWLELVDQDLRDPQWTDRLPYRRFDAVVSTTALHWMQLEDLSKLYAQVAGLLKSGGVFINGDHQPDESNGAVLNTLSEQLLAAQARRTGTTDGDDWSTWWLAANAAAELADLATERARRAIAHDRDGNVGLTDQVRLLRAWGFAEAGPVWQFGHDRILVGVR